MDKKRETNDTPPASGFRNLLRAFSSRNYRLLFAGQAISLIGTWMQNISMNWLVYRLTGSPLLLGASGFALDIPSFIIMPYIGVIVDRSNKRLLLAATQVVSMLQAFLLAFLVLTDSVRVWHLFVLAVVLGIANAFEMPTRQSFVVDTLEKKDDLPNAIALNSSLFNAARLAGPSIAGIIIAAAGEGYCFLFNGFSFIAAITTLAAMRVKKKKAAPAQVGGFTAMKEGFTYAFGSVPIRGIILMVALLSLVGMSYTVLMPVVAKEVLGGGANTLGFLVGFAGLGALAAAVYLASRTNVHGLGKLIPVSAVLFGAGLVFMGLSRSFNVSLVIMVLCGFGMLALMGSCNTLLQTIVDDDKRGRVLSIFIMAFRGVVPFGSLLLGGLAARIGAQYTLVAGGSAVILGAFLFARYLPVMRKHAPENIY